MNSWRDTTLGEVINLKRGYDLPKRSRVTGSIPIISSSGTTGWHDHAKAISPGVVTGRYGTLGKVYYVDVPFWPLNTTLYVKDFKSNHERFVAYFLEGMALERYDGAAAVPGLDRNVLHQIEIHWPSLDVQRKIASVLASYDELIENNLRRIEILEEMAQSVYREWFVNLRFPGHEKADLVDSSLGPVPDGWNPSNFGSIAREVKDGVDPEQLKPDTPYVGLEHIPKMSFTLVDLGVAADVRSRKWRFEPGDVLFGRLRPYFHKVAASAVDGVCSTDAIVIRAEPGFSSLVLQVAFSKEFVDHAVGTSGGTDRPRAKWSDLQQFGLALPPHGLREEFSSVVDPLVRLAVNLASQNTNLRVTRDLLLPRLVSGAVDVSDLDIDTGWLAA